MHVRDRKDYFGNQTCLILQYITHSIGLTSPPILLLFYLLVQRNLTDVHTTFGVVNMKIIVRAFVVVLALTGAAASTQITSASAQTKVVVGKTSAIPTPMCAPDDPNACGFR